MKRRCLLRVAPLAVAAALFAGAAFAQSPAPPKLEPLPEIPAPTADPELEPQVTIIRREEETVEEVRVGGELKYVKVTPRHGRPYFLVPDRAGSGMLRRDSLESPLRVPQWVLFSW